MIILSVDLGDKRTGLAICDKTELIASPYGTIEEEDRGKLAQCVLEKVDESQAELIVLGLPKNMDGSEGSSAEKSKAFKKRLNNISDIPVELIDERCTTMLAHSYLNTTNTRGKKRKSIIDSVSAVVILEDYIKQRKKSLEE